MEFSEAEHLNGRSLERPIASVSAEQFRWLVRFRTWRRLNREDRLKRWWLKSHSANANKRSERRLVRAGCLFPDPEGSMW